MSTITARSVRRQIIKAGKHPDFPNGLPGVKRGVRRNTRFTKCWTLARLPNEDLDQLRRLQEAGYTHLTDGTKRSIDGILVMYAKAARHTR